MTSDALDWDAVTGALAEVRERFPPATTAVAIVMQPDDVYRLARGVPEPRVANLGEVFCAPGLEVRSDRYAKPGGFTVEFADGHTEWFDFEEVGDGD